MNQPPLPGEDRDSPGSKERSATPADRHVRRVSSGAEDEPLDAPVRGGLRRSAWWLRVAAGFMSVGLIMPLGVARALSPAASGLGTHQQLGLPPCSMRVLFGMRCPACGMTTSWSHWTRGHWWVSAEANVGGFCLAFLVVAVAMLASRVTWTGQLPGTRTLTAVGWAIVGTGVVTLADWLVRLSG